jgi:glycosyltransferase involved in cell wall biosynthesis
MLTFHRARATWSKSVNLYFTLTEFARSKFLEAGWPAEQIAVKGNFVSPDLGFESGATERAVYVGRLSSEKGIETLLAAWRSIPNPPLLQIVGEGPLQSRVEAAAADSASIEWLGRRPVREVLEILGQAICVILPSVCYETFGRTIIEAFSRGTPALVARQGAMAELVDHGRTGLLFTPGDPDDLAAKLTQMTSDSARLLAMRKAARAEYEAKYTAEANYRSLRKIYDRATGRATESRNHP